MPLGKLSKETVLKGYAILSKIEKELKGNSNHLVLADLSGDFYTNIPHNFGMAKMANFIIDSMAKVKEKYDLITDLLDI